MDRRIQIGLTVASGATLIASFFGLHPAVPYVSIAAGSVIALRSAWRSIASREIDVNVLMVLAALGSVLLGLPVEAAVLLFLFALSGTLEEFAMARTKSAIEGLIKLRPETALRVTASGDTAVPLQQLKVGDSVRVRPFEAIPVDGEITEGETSVDQSAMTGESHLVPKKPGERVLAGTQNTEGMIVIRVTTEHGRTTLDKIVELVQDAQENKASGERISAWFGTRYTFFVIGAFVVSLVVRLLIGQESERAIYASLSLFVALSPCALVISVPAATLSALAWAARRGILVRGGAYIEAIGTIDTAVMDKTGTLTSGRPKLAQICVCDTVPALVGAKTECAERDACWRLGESMATDSKDILRMAASAEQYSTHPIAQAIVDAAREQGMTVPQASAQQSLSGLGVVATVEGKQVRVGQRRFFEQDGAQLPDHFAEHVEELQHQGMTVAIAECDGEYAALGLEDVVRPEAKSVLEDLRSLGVTRQIMLTGDTKQTAAAVAKQLAIEEVQAGLLPDDKERIVAQLVDENKRVLMVGDGVNDAPSLARAHVGVAMGGLGSDVALNAADVVLMQDRLASLPALVRLGRRTNTVIRQNLAFGTGVIAVLFVGSIVWDALFPATRNLILPLAVIGHEGSTVLVILNGLRLLKD
jgi:Cd2+/Zn2+-exporting ATPase